MHTISKYVDIYRILWDARNNIFDSKKAAMKYIDNFPEFLLEKLHVIELAELQTNSACLDISTGAGLLPALLRLDGHTVHTTDIPNALCDLDPEFNNEPEYVQIRKMLEVDIDFRLDVQKQKPLDLKQRYDCIFSTRIVFSKANDDRVWNADDIKFFVNNLLDYSDKAVLKWNYSRIPNHLQDVLVPYLTDSQFINGTITKHTEKI